MPFIQRTIEPKFLSRGSIFNEDGTAKLTGQELEAVSNSTLCNALKQLASLTVVAEEIFKELGGQLKLVFQRCENVKNRIAFIEDKVEKFDPKKVTVPVGDICSFAQTKEHYVAKHPMDSNLFGIETRPDTLKALYEAAAKTPVHVMRQLDRWRRDGHRSSRFFVCTPVLGARRRRIRGKVDIDIETRMPAVVEDLRRWTSDEALGDVTVYPNNCATRISSASVALSDGEQTDGTIISDDEAIDHKLPSPEEQLQVVALKFPAEVVCVDITGRSFDRMSMQRRSLTTGEVSNNRTMDGETTVRRRGRTRRPRNRRRNTLAGTDQKEIQNALIAGDESSTVDAADATKRETQTTVPSTVPRSKSSDLLRSISTRNNNNNNKESAEIKISRFNSLKQWGKSQYEKLRLNNNNNKSSENKNESIINNNNNSSSNKSRISSSEDGLDDFNLYETVTMKRRRDLSKERISNKTHHERNPSISSSEKSIAVNGNTNNNNAMTSVINFAVKLRDSSLQRRQRRQGSASGNNRDQEPHSSSGNWSASSESGRASIGSEITSTTTTHPKSSTSAATSNNSLNHPPSSVNSKRRFNFNTNTTTTISTTSGSVTSEGSTLTPDIIHDLHEDGDSVYSCDTEGYYTSFHMDSGLKTLKEEDLPSTPLQSTSAFSNSAGSNNNNNTTAENEYELFGKGSTSTTTSSAGTVCTTLRAADSNRSLIIIGPSVPERKSSLSKLSTKSAESSLERMNNNKNDTIKRSPGLNNNSSNKPTVVAVIHKNNNGDISPDSGHNTSSSPIESVSSPMNDDGVRSRAGSDFEFSESSDMEGAERIERIRIKTTCNSSRIPSMCAITPSQSDDDDNSSNSTSSAYKKQIEVNNLKNNNNINGNLGYDDDDDGMNKKVSIFNRNVETGYVTVEQLLDQPDGIIKISSNNNNLIRAPSPSGGSVTVIKQESAAAKSSIHQPIIKSSLMPFNQMLGKLKNNISNFTNNNKKDLHNNKRSSIENPSSAEDDLLGEYVTLADVRNNNDNSNTYINDVINRNLKTVLSGKIRDAEYVSLNELPIIKDNNNAIISTTADSLERKHRQGARVMLDAEGKVVYSSDSLKRRKTPTTFEPGPFVKQITAANNDASSSPQMLMRVSKPIRSVTNHQDQKMKLNVPQTEFNRPLSPTYSSTGNKVIIKASGTQPEIVRNPASVVLQPVSPKMRPLSPKGAYVHVVHHQSSTTGGSSSSSSSSSLLSPKKLREGVINTAPLQNLIENPHQELQFLEPSQKPLMYGPAENNDPYFYPQSNYLHQHKKEVNFYSTLPSKRTPSSYFSYDNIPPERSVTPDITRGLVDRTKSGSTGTFFKSADQNLLTMGHKIGIPVKMPQINIRQNKINIDDSLKISPIDPRNTGGGGGFKSSTPSQIIKKAAENLDSKLLLSPNKRSTMSNDELYAVIHKTKKKLDIQKDDFSKIAPLIEPSTKPSSSSNRKSEIETGYIGSRQSWSSPSKGEYVDFNADIDKVSPINNNEPKNRQSWAAACNDRKGGVKKTSALDFKRLLLQKSSTTITSGNTKKLSAVEQLKISKEQMLKQNKEGTLNSSNNNKKPSSSSASTDMTILDFSSSPRSLLNRKLFNTVPSTPGSPERGTGSKSVPIKVLSPRSQWRFTNPRSDVLSTTILEDCREDDNSSNASKSSLEKRINLHCTIEQSSNTVNREKIPDFPDAPSQNIVEKFNNNKQSSNKESTKYVSVTDRMSAQRSKFFGTSSSNLNNPNQENNPSKNKKMPPTLETAF